MIFKSYFKIHLCTYQKSVHGRSTWKLLKDYKEWKCNVQYIIKNWFLVNASFNDLIMYILKINTNFYFGFI